MTVVCHTSELIPQSNFCLDSKHFSAGLMLDRVYAIKWPLRYRETLKYVLPLKGETPSLSSSLPMLQSLLSCHHVTNCHHHHIYIIIMKQFDFIALLAGTGRSLE